MNIARLAIAPTLALSIAVGGFAIDASANAKGDEVAVGCAFGIAEGPAVVITGGTISNETNLDLSANAGTAIGDASGGNNGVAVTGGNDDLGDIAAVGQGGGANASANGGAIAVGDINSGSNAGNAIVVGDTANCLPEPEPVKPAPEKPVAEKPVAEKPAKPGKKDDVVYEAPAEEAPVFEAPAAVVALPATGVGFIDAGLLSALAAAGAAGAAGLGLRRRS